MIDVKSIVLLGFWLVACSSETLNGPLFGGSGAAGAGGEAGVAGGGAAGDAGTDAVEASDPCGPLMLLSGSVCVDEKPALHADGSQGAAVSFAEAVATCEGRGARLCTEAEREEACPGGQEPASGANAEFCAGPSATWEWSMSSACAEGRCVSPCCNSAAYPCQCSEEPTKVHGFRCCRNL